MIHFLKKDRTPDKTKFLEEALISVSIIPLMSENQRYKSKILYFGNLLSSGIYNNLKNFDVTYILTEDRDNFFKSLKLNTQIVSEHHYNEVLSHINDQYDLIIFDEVLGLYNNVDLFRVVSKCQNIKNVIAFDFNILPFMFPTPGEENPFLNEKFLINMKKYNKNEANGEKRTRFTPYLLQAVFKHFSLHDTIMLKVMGAEVEDTLAQHIFEIEPFLKDISGKYICYQGRLK